MAGIGRKILFSSVSFTMRGRSGCVQSCFKDNKSKTDVDIAGVVAFLTENEPRGESEELQSHAWRTGIGLRKVASVR